jgi:polysaccharide chain length determinant protein (PEP-CTERM system associated)
MIAGLFVALLVSSRLPDIYEAETLIQIVPQRVPDSFVASTITIRTEDRLNALSQQVQSRSQLERIIVDLGLYENELRVRSVEDVSELIRSSITVQTVRAGGAQGVEAFYLRFMYTDPVIAARVTERVGSLYISFNARERGKLAEGANDFLQTQMNDARARLEEQERKLQAFRERYAGRLPEQLQSNMQAIQNIQLQRQALVESLARDRDRKLMLERLYNDAMAEPAPGRAAAPTAPAGGDAGPRAVAAMSPAQQLEVARANLAQLTLRLKEEHPDVRRARKQVADLVKLRDSRRGSGTEALASAISTPEELQRRERISAMRAEIESLSRAVAFKEAEEQRLGGAIADYQRRIESVPGVQSEWVSLTREYDTVQTSFRDLLTKSEAARISVDLEAQQISEQFRVLDPPRVPGRPISPKRHLISAAGALAGLGMGLCVVLLLEWRNGSLATELDVEQVLKLPVIAIVPAMPTARDVSRQRRRWRLTTTAALVVAVLSLWVFWSLHLWKFVV